MCTDRGTLDDNTHGYCCSSTTTPCAYNPIAACTEPAPTYGYQCRGADRPEAFNSMLFCGDGVEEGDLINYCCSNKDNWSGQIINQTGCMPYGNQPGCDNRMLAFQCGGKSLPTEEALAANKSKADINRLVCSTPTPFGPNSYYCCYIPALVPAGGSCVQDTTVQGCTSQIGINGMHFGFACYGPETPADDYPPMTCAGPGVPGTSAEGYPAKLYCCQYL